MAFVRGLVCRACGHRAGEGPTHVCDECLGPLEIDYDQAAIRAVVSRARIAGGPPSIWRYQDLLPVREPAVGWHVGMTPLVHARRLGARWGLRALYLKDDGACHPTGSFKDRVVSVAVSKARELGFTAVSCASTGNLAASLAAHAAAADLAAYVFVPAGLEAGKMASARMHGAVVLVVEGSYDDANRLSAELADRCAWAFVNVTLRPYYAEGAKTVGYEIAEQLGWRLPAHVVVPCAGGGLLVAVARAFGELRALGLVERGEARLHAAQPAGCAPIVRAVQEGARSVTPVRPATIATSLAMGSPADGPEAAEAVRASGGWAEAPTDEEALECVELLARTEGIFAEPAGGVALAAARRLADAGRIGPDEPAVVCLTGSGLKTIEAVEPRLAPPIRVRPSVAAVEAALSEAPAITTR